MRYEPTLKETIEYERCEGCSGEYRTEQIREFCVLIPDGWRWVEYCPECAALARSNWTGETFLVFDETELEVMRRGPFVVFDKFGRDDVKFETLKFAQYYATGLAAALCDRVNVQKSGDVVFTAEPPTSQKTDPPAEQGRAFVGAVLDAHAETLTRESLVELVLEVLDVCTDAAEAKHWTTEESEIRAAKLDLWAKLTDDGRAERDS